MKYEAGYEVLRLIFCSNSIKVKGAVFQDEPNLYIKLLYWDRWAFGDDTCEIWDMEAPVQIILFTTFVTDSKAKLEH